LVGIWRVIDRLSWGSSSIEVAAAVDFSNQTFLVVSRLFLLPASVTLRNYPALVRLDFVLKKQIVRSDTIVI